MPLTWRNETFYTVAEAAGVFGVSERTLRADLSAGRIVFAEVRGKRYIAGSTLDSMFGTTSRAEPPPLRTTAEMRRAAEAATKRLEKKGYRRE